MDITSKRGYRDSAQLEKWGAVDTTPRVVGKKGKIRVKCLCCDCESDQYMAVLYNLERKSTRWRCYECGHKAGAEKRTTGNRPPGSSRKSSAWRTEDILKQMNIVDLTPRVVRSDEFVLVRCCSCENTGSIRYNGQNQHLTVYGEGWRCDVCSHLLKSKIASEKTGDKNSFYGRKHSERTKELLSQATTDKWNSLSSDEKEKRLEALNKSKP